TCMEMLEHVPDPGAVIEACARLLKPGGRLFLSTLNRTPAAFALAILGAEYVARLLPKGTYQYRDFIRPSELGAWLRGAGLQLEDVSGLMYEPWRNPARVTRRTDVNYLACPLKPEGVRASRQQCLSTWTAPCSTAPPTCLRPSTPCVVRAARRRCCWRNCVPTSPREPVRWCGRPSPNWTTPSARRGSPSSSRPTSANW